MGAGLLALKIQSTILIVFLRAFVTIKITIIKHVDLYEINHLIVHDFALANLKCQILVIFVILGGLRVFTNIIKHQLSIVVHNVRTKCDKAELLGAVHYISRVTFFDIRHHV